MEYIGVEWDINEYTYMEYNIYNLYNIFSEFFRHSRIKAISMTIPLVNSENPPR